MSGNEGIKSIQDKYERLSPYLNEKTRRIWAAIEAQSLGWGGISQVSRATGMSRTTIHAGIGLLSQPNGAKTEDESLRIREVGGGRKLLEEQDPMLLTDLESLVEPMTLGDPESPLKWTSKSVVKLAQALNQGGHRISSKSVDNLLESLGYSLQSNRKTRDGKQNADRDGQFLHSLFCHITQNWRGRPLTSLQVVINLIRNTTTQQGLQVEARLDENFYKTGIKVTDQEFKAIAIERNSFRGEWNYVIKPRIPA
jgi:hypothetical protein